jgi:hypothetical protein
MWPLAKTQTWLCLRSSLTLYLSYALRFRTHTLTQMHRNITSFGAHINKHTQKDLVDCGQSHMRHSPRTSRCRVIDRPLHAKHAVDHWSGREWTIRHAIRVQRAAR